MSDKANNPPGKQADRLKNPSTIGTQHNPVSSPGETTNPVEEDLAEQAKIQRKAKERRARESEPPVDRT